MGPVSYTHLDVYKRQTGNYTWKDIYLADFSVRFDGSSDFVSNQRWAPFFSGGLGVNIHNYEFLKGNEIVNKVKVRASYGRTRCV